MKIIGMRRLARWVLGLLVGAAVVGTGQVSRAQPTCADPFAGVSVRFNPDVWTLTDFCQHSVAYVEILSGGPPPDGIPPIDDPQFETIAAAQSWLQPQSPVLVVEIEEQARAYPLAILTWHEIVNDRIGDTPVAITFCPLCNSAFAFDRRVDDVVLRFGVSGNLRNSNLLMWDDRTQSWWQQFTGEAVVGAYTGTVLRSYPALITGFGAFAEQYPQGVVLTRMTGVSRPYGQNPYQGYDQTANPFLFTGTLDPRLPATAHVLAGFIGGQGVAYPFDVLRELQVINDIVEDVPLVAFWQGGAASALGDAQIDRGADIGWAALYTRTIGQTVLSFSLDDQRLIRDDQTGSLWNAFGQAVEGTLAGTQLERLVAAPHFWFAWAAFDVDTILYVHDAAAETGGASE
jgi:hypothetical protein